MNYNWHRYYQPKIGQYYQTDPYWGFRFGGTYNYAENNPTIIVDPFGLFGTREFWQLYRHAGGKVGVDLAQVGLLGKFRNTRSVRRATSAFENTTLVNVGKQAKVSCEGCDKGRKTLNYSFDLPTKKWTVS